MNLEEAYELALVSMKLARLAPSQENIHQARLAGERWAEQAKRVIDFGDRVAVGNQASQLMRELGPLLTRMHADSTTLLDRVAIERN